MSSNGYYITTVSPYGSASPGIFVSSSYNQGQNDDFTASTGNNGVDLTGYYWTSVASSSSGQFQYAVASANDQTETGGAQNGGVFYSTDFGNSFTKNSTNNFSGGYWNSVSVSSNGQFVTLVSGNKSVIDGTTGATGPTGSVYISNNDGATYAIVPSMSMPSQNNNYISVAMSSSGQYQTIVAFGPTSSGTSNMFTSSNYGITWTTVPQVAFNNDSNGVTGINSPTWDWKSVSMSASGQYQTAVASTSNTGDYIYISNDYGINWYYKSPGNLNNGTGIWSAVSVSSSGQYQLACYNDDTSGGSGGLYFSQNYGNNFQRLDNSANNWYCCAISSSGQIQAAGIAPFKLYSSGTIDYGDTTYGLYISMQNIYLGGTKTFVIDHPTNNNKYLVHACLEGPEAGVYYRGEGEITNNESTIIKLPDYVAKIAYQLTVNLTPINDDGTKKQLILTSSRVKNNEFTVYGPNCEFFWTVYGKRHDINVEPLKQLTQVKGTGPYTWI